MERREDARGRRSKERGRDGHGSGGITAGQFGAKPHLKFKIFSQFSVAFKKYFWNL